MNQSRRSVLQDIQPESTTHAGLWLEKFYNQCDVSDEKKAKNILIHQVVDDIQETELYASFFKRWKNVLRQLKVKPEKATVKGRLAINLGTESVLETNIALHHTYGTPYIPGSALKGLAAFYARNHLKSEEWGETEPAYRTLFGYGEQAGYVTFFDALYIPGSGFKGKALWPDIITTHHPDYYKGKLNAAPADWDSPIPISFLTATGDYLIALAGPEAWVEAGLKILKLALKELGIGAKTSSGYGRMILGEEMSEEKTEKEPYESAKNRILSDEVPPAGRFRGTVKEVGQKDSFGFIYPARGGEKVFVHRNNFVKPVERIIKDVVVEYSLIKNDKGEPQAKDMVILLRPD